MDLARVRAWARKAQDDSPGKGATAALQLLAVDPFTGMRDPCLHSIAPSNVAPSLGPLARRLTHPLACHGHTGTHTHEDREKLTKPVPSAGCQEHKPITLSGKAQLADAAGVCLAADATQRPSSWEVGP